MTPPRQPRRRIASSAGGREARARALEGEENTCGSSLALVCRFLVLFPIEIHSSTAPRQKGYEKEHLSRFVANQDAKAVKSAVPVRTLSPTYNVRFDFPESIASVWRQWIGPQVVSWFSAGHGSMRSSLENSRPYQNHPSPWLRAGFGWGTCSG
jgi:hypothetical protein